MRLEFNYESVTEDQLPYGWKVISFGRRHFNYQNPVNLAGRKASTEFGIPLNLDWIRKMRSCSAFVLSYFEHGNCRWWLEMDGGHDMPDMRWDGCRYAGILYWDCEEPLTRTRKTRIEMARQYIELYTKWCNGEGIEVQATSSNDDDTQYYGPYFDMEDAFPNLIHEISLQTITNDCVLSGDRELISEFREALLAHRQASGTMAVSTQA